jgi:Protein of unknown function (DUF2975)
MMTTRQRKVTEPLGSVTEFLGLMLLFLLVSGLAFTIFGSGSIGGFGDASVCVTQPGTTGDSGWTSPISKAKPGTSIQVNGQIVACGNHPSFGQRVLYTLTSLPGLLVWAGVLFLLWRVMVIARRTGPFTISVAIAMRRLGWVILAGTVVANAIQGLATDQLLNELIRPDTSYADAIIDPVRALVPVPLLAGAALLTFARIIRLGADMDDEIKGTV